MINPEPFFEVLTRFSRTLASRYDISDVLYELSDSVVVVLDAAGAGVSLADDDGRLRFATASTDLVNNVEQIQQDTQQGPCHRAYNTNEAVFISDLSATDDWPTLRDAALQAGLRSAAGIPMALDGVALGSLNIYDSKIRVWTPDDAAAAQVLADIATGYVAHASELEQARRINEQLQAALDTRVLVEQAKGLLAGERGISLDEAFNLLRRHARSHNAPVRSVAQAVVELGMRP
jgi:GAF domain-containing protein